MDMSKAPEGKWKAWISTGSNGFWYIDRDGSFSAVTCYNENAEQNARRFAASANQLAFLPLDLLENPDYSVEKELSFLDDQIAGRKKAEAQRDELLAALKALYGWSKAEVEHFGANTPDDFIIEMVEKVLADA